MAEGATASQMKKLLELQEIANKQNDEIIKLLTGINTKLALFPGTRWRTDGS